jgi:hypothetical protein
MIWSTNYVMILILQCAHAHCKNPLSPKPTKELNKFNFKKEDMLEQVEYNKSRYPSQALASDPLPPSSGRFILKTASLNSSFRKSDSHLVGDCHFPFHSALRHNLRQARSLVPVTLFPSSGR